MKELKKYFIIKASPEEVYLALTTPTAIQLWSGDPAVMSTEVGSEFSLWEGNIVGKNLEFVENQKIVQEWYFGDQEDASIVTIKLHPHKSGTSAELHHINIPDEGFEEIAEGWTFEYFGAIQDFF
jgi:uncharacterized protein YndB with AHSA1/START domain